MVYKEGRFKGEFDKVKAEVETMGTAATSPDASVGSAGVPPAPPNVPKPGAAADAPKSAEAGPAAPAPEVAPEAPPVALPETEELKKEREKQEQKAKRLAELKEKMDDLDELYAKYSGESYASQGFISRLVGKHKEYDTMITEYRVRWIQAKDLYEKAVNDDLQENFEQGKINEKEYRAQTIDLKLQSLMRKLSNDERKIYYQNKKGEERGWLSKKVEKGLGSFVDRWRKLPFTVKFGGAIALGLIGGPASVIGLGALRVIGAVAGGKAAQEKLQAMAIEKRKKDIEKEMRKFEMTVNKLDVNNLHKLAHEQLDSQNSRMSEKIVSEANWDAGRKVVGIATGIVIEELGRLGVGKILFQKIQHMLGFGMPVIVPETGGGKGGITTPEGAGKGLVVPEKMPGKTGLSEALEVKKGHSSMGTLRRFALSKFDMITGDGHYNPNDALVNDYYQNMKFHHKLPSGLANFDDVRSMPKSAQQEFFKFCDNRMNDYYHGLKRTIVENMRHNPKYYNSLSSEMKQLADSINNFDDYRNLPPGLKKVVFADREAANWIFDKHHSFQEVPKIKAGQMLNVTQDTSGKIFLGDASGIKAGYLHHGAGRGAVGYEPSGRKPAWLEALDERQRAAQAKFAEAASVSDKTHADLVQSRGPLAASSAAEAAAMNDTMAHKWFDYIQEGIYGKGTTVDWHQPAREFRQKFLGSFLTSDQPMGPPVDVGDQRNFWRAAQELNNRLGDPIGNESTKEWLTRGLNQGRISSEDALRALNRVVNQ